MISLRWSLALGLGGLCVVAVPCQTAFAESEHGLLEALQGLVGIIHQARDSGAVGQKPAAVATEVVGAAYTALEQQHEVNRDIHHAFAAMLDQLYDAEASTVREIAYSQQRRVGVEIRAAGHTLAPGHKTSDVVVAIVGPEQSAPHRLHHQRTQPERATAHYQGKIVARSIGSRCKASMLVLRLRSGEKSTPPEVQLRYRARRGSCRVGTP